MRKNSKKHLYESIMKSVSKTIKKHLNENRTITMTSDIMENAISELQGEIDETGLTNITWPVYASICISVGVDPFSDAWVELVQDRFGCDLSYGTNIDEDSDQMYILTKLLGYGYDKISLIRRYIDILPNGYETKFLDTLQVALYKEYGVVYDLDDLKTVIKVVIY